MTVVANDGLARATWGLVELTATSVDPTAPTLSAVQLTDTSIRATIDGDAGVTNNLLYRASSDLAWTSGGNRSGDGDIDITGLTTGTEYLILAYSDNGNSLSVPSNEISVTLLSTATTTTPTGDAAIYLNEFGSAIVGIYKPTGKSNRSILYILDYEEPEDLAGGLAPSIKITVANSSVFGISTDEVDLALDKIAIAVRLGENAQDRRIFRIVFQDVSMVTYEIR